MPTKVKNNLNQAIVSNITNAEINGAGRPFVGLQINNLASQRVLVSGLIWSVLFTDPNDIPNAFCAEIICQRGVTLASDAIIFPQQTEEMLIFFETTVYADMKNFIPAIPLEPGSSYGIALDLARRLPFVGAAILSLTVLGQQVSTIGQTFPLDLR